MGNRGWLQRGRCACAVALLVAVCGPRCMAQRAWPLWQSYSTKFLDSSGRIIDRSAGDITTSEGQAYAMFFALVANDRKSFDKLLRWTEDNLASGDLTAHLPAWKWGKNNSGEWKQLDTNSAADADLWLAYDCLEAGRLWRDTRLLKLGQTVALQIGHSEIMAIPGVGTVLLPGPTGFKLPDGTYLLNASYTPPQLVARLKLESSQEPWRAVQSSWPHLLQKSSPSGFVSDWLAVGSTIKPTVPLGTNTDNKAAVQPVGSYDAIRVYLWLGMADRATSGVSAALKSTSGMAGYLAANTVPPLRVEAGGKVLDPASPVGFSAAVYPYLVALGKLAAARAQMTRLQASADATTGLYGRNGEYYDQNLALFATGWSEQRFRFDRDGRLKVRW